MKEAYLWSERYRPSKLTDVIIPDSVRVQFDSYITDRQIPNLLLTSPNPGTGKTTTARALCNEIGVESPMFINASMNNSIDDIRMSVTQYATTMSMFGESNHKVVILDEADRLSAQAQDSLKGLIEEVHTNCRFILTANTKSRIVEPLQSRCVNIDFLFTKAESDKMMARMFKRVCEILKDEGIEYDQKVVAETTKKFFPDNRRLLGFLQNESRKGSIGPDTLARINSGSPDALIAAMKAKKYGDCKSWVVENADRLNDDFYGKLFKMLEGAVNDQSVPQIVLILGDYQRYHNTVPDRFIHFLALVTELMMGTQFK